MGKRGMGAWLMLGCALALAACAAPASDDAAGGTAQAVAGSAHSGGRY